MRTTNFVGESLHKNRALILALSNAAESQRGVGILEPIISIVIITIVLTTSLSLFSISSRSRQKAYQRTALLASVDANLAEIRDQASRLTCCSGQCTIGIPSGITPGSSSVCATADRNDDRYFFPQRDNPATTFPFTNTTEAREPYAVDQLCASQANLVVAPLKQAINAASTGSLATPTGTTRTVGDLPGNALQISYAETSTGAVLRVERIVPPVVNYCP